MSDEIAADVVLRVRLPLRVPVASRSHIPERTRQPERAAVDTPMDGDIEPKALVQVVAQDRVACVWSARVNAHGDDKELALKFDETQLPPFP